MSSILVQTDSIDELVQMLRMHVVETGKPYLDQLEMLVKWSSRITAANQLAIVVSSGMSRPFEVRSALAYIKRQTEAKYTPSPGQSRVKAADIAAFFDMTEALYEKGLFDATEEHLGIYPWLFPEHGDKIMCGHARSVCECGIVHGGDIYPYCLECSRPRKLCRNEALLNGRCVDHGGRLPEGRSRGTIYRQGMSQDMALIHGAIEGEAHLSLDAEIAVAVSCLAAAMNDIPVSPTKEIRRIQSRITKAIEDDDAAAMVAATTELRQAMDRDGGQAGGEVREWLRVISQLTAQERENRKTAAEFIHIDDHEAELDRVAEVFRVGMDRSYSRIRGIVRDGIARAMANNPGGRADLIADEVIRDMTNNARYIEQALLEPYEDINDKG